jgi:hypothetical protein
MRVTVNGEFGDERTTTMGGGRLFSSGSPPRRGPASREAHQGHAQCERSTPYTLTAVFNTVNDTKRAQTTTNAHATDAQPFRAERQRAFLFAG